MIRVEFELSQAPTALALYEQLIQKLFDKQFDVERVVCSELPGGYTGLSSLDILFAQPFDAHDKEYNPLIVRIGPKAVIDSEKERYERYVVPSLGPYKALLHLHTTIDATSAIAYGLLFDQQNYQPLQTLRLLLQNGKERDLDAICQALTVLFRELAPSNPKRGWYNHYQSLNGQRPLWFYNTVLPSTMILHQIEIAKQQGGALSVLKRIAQADQPAGAQLKGQRVALHTNKLYPHLRVAERDLKGEHGRLRLYLYEPLPPQPGPHQLQPVAARIDVVGPSAVIDALPDDLDNVSLQGWVSDTRYDWFNSLWQQRFQRLPKQTAEGDIPHQTMILKNPFLRYYDLLSRKRTLITSIIHGDLNLGNILLSQSASGEEFTAWLIDFDKTRPAGHTVFDAVRLETEYKTRVLPYRLRGIDEFIRLEKALYQGLIDPTEEFHDIRDHANLRDAYQFISTVRRGLSCGPRHKIPPAEYYLGLLAYGLAALKYENLYTHETWLQRASYVRPRAVAAYLSASFAATVVEQCEKVVATCESYPPIRRSRPSARIKRPWLVGRDDILKKALLKLSNHKPAVLLYGQPGSGRGALAQALCAELEDKGYNIFPPIPTMPGLIATADALIDALLSFLELYGARAGISRIRKSASRMQVGRRITDLQYVAGQLATALDSKPACLVLHLENADHELYTLIAQLVGTVRGTAVILISDQRHNFLQSDALLEVLPLNQQDVRAYVRAKPLELEDEAIERLYRVSYGLPDLLIRTIEKAHARQQQDGGTLQQAVLGIEEAPDLVGFIDDVLKHMPVGVRLLFEIHALLRKYSPDSLDHIDALLNYILLDHTATSPESSSATIDAYRQRPFYANDDTGLATLVRSRALENLERHDAMRFQSICDRIACFYRDRSHPDQHLIARYQALAGQWDDAAATLATFAGDPAEIFNDRCSRLYELTDKVIRNAVGYDEECLLEMAGDCAAYLGRYQEAASHYKRLAAILYKDNPMRPRIIARLLRVHTAYGDAEQALRVRELLFKSTTEGDPLYALGLAHEGIELLRTAPERAVSRIALAITILEATRERWGDDRLFYEEERVLLYDSLARAEAMREDANADMAIEHLLKVRPIAKKELRNMSLVAQIDNDLGYIYYYIRGQSDDPQLALQCFDHAYRERTRLGDFDGQLRAGQNLANLRVNLASTQKEWLEAAEIFQKCIKIAADVQSGDRDLITANYMDALIHRGEFGTARSQFDALAPTLKAIRSPETQLILLLNRAKLALWEHNAEECRMYLTEVSPLIHDVGAAIDKIEWAQISLECDIRNHRRPDDQAVKWVDTISVSDHKRLPDAAEWFFAQGLLAVVRGAYEQALEQFASCYRLWSSLSYHYRVAISAYWRAYTEICAGDSATAQVSAAHALALLEPFGDTPILGRLRHLFYNLPGRF